MRGVLVISMLGLGCGAYDPCEELGVFVAGGQTQHLASCSDPALCGNGTQPPTAGAHCAEVTTCRVHAEPQARCRWIHNLEHGHAVLLYNCPDGCADVVAELTALRDASAQRARTLITPDPSLTTRVGAAVWGYGWAGQAVDPEAIRCVLSRQDDDAPERGLGCPP